MLSNGIENEVIRSEADIEQLFRVETQEQLALWELKGIERKNKTFLEMLGYSNSDIEDHPVKVVVVGQIRYAPDYILKRQQKKLAIIDLKAPGQNLDRERWMGQIKSYCRELNIPIGVLFNGTELRVFVNTDFPGLRKHRDLFLDQPVASANFQGSKGSYERKQMVDILLKFAAETLEPNPVAIANGFAKKQRELIDSRNRQKRIQNRLMSILANPSAPMFRALASVEGIWDDTEQKPSEVELIKSWQGIINAQPAGKPKRKTALTKPKPEQNSPI